MRYAMPTSATMRILYRFHNLNHMVYVMENSLEFGWHGPCKHACLVVTHPGYLVRKSDSKLETPVRNLREFARTARRVVTSTLKTISINRCLGALGWCPMYGVQYVRLRARFNKRKRDDGPVARYDGLTH